MNGRPHVICHMLVSVDGRIHPSRWTESPDGTRQDWSVIYEQVHKTLQADAWVVGRVTMAEMSSVGAHPPALPHPPDRPTYLHRSVAGPYGIALDPSGKLHFDNPKVSGDQVVVLLGRDVTDSHLAELAADGVFYIVAQEDPMDVGAMLELLRRELGVQRLLLEGGGRTNGRFFRAGLVNEVSLLLAPAIDGGEGVSGAFDAGAIIRDAARLSLESVERLERGVVHLRYRVD